MLQLYQYYYWQFSSVKDSFYQLHWKINYGMQCCNKTVIIKTAFKAYQDILCRGEISCTRSGKVSSCRYCFLRMITRVWRYLWR
ncbi:hypothetical protein CS542_05315 [Pedobacter sp. IW39]|nr:hypothetical protein CS542_05315 [Pedobacter sp. IW39]